MKDIIRDHCPHCSKTTPQAVFRERLLAAVHWCQSCYGVIVRNDDHATNTAAQADAA